MIDFTNMIRKNKTFNGASGNKISIIYNNELYMLKFSPAAKKNKNMSYSNSTISEFIGSNIFKTVGIPVQETLLGYYKVNNKIKIVVACKDFTKPGVIIQDFASLKNTMIESNENGYGTELQTIIDTIETQIVIDQVELKKRFWDMFIVDALIGNMDRHNGNWGFLYNTLTDQVELASVYDCGSSLYPQADINVMTKVLADINELKIRVYEFPTSAINHNGKRINYFDFISSHSNPDCTAALLRIHSKINLENIYNLIDRIECISDLEKEFYKYLIKERKERILDYSVKLLLDRDLK